MMKSSPLDSAYLYDSGTLGVIHNSKLPYKFGAYYGDVEQLRQRAEHSMADRFVFDEKKWWSQIKPVFPRLLHRCRRDCDIHWMPFKNWAFVCLERFRDSIGQLPSSVVR